MRTRTREVVRMLATLRHSAHCRRLRAASAAQAARDLANEVASAAPPEDDDPADSATDAAAPRSGVH
ncbi:hypothetical protein QCE63_30465 [Caballeronia sp. LZ065]|uniref:hypothetical protein n=1 Tax=Caballeronia sp. LZ065 TaxID=3038571 RepID=UPI00285CC3F0|nr:hypothetical protein [Caballeronia sp. LZ065]MDR5783743.1 hypothetical protein [Caballeronia sp. LZ065]